ncbi:SGNH/GDSL hydrolase family protein [Allokutzneria multivorans]|uniref:SGNH/GDSL hydrolase family protein n=2 Tax=Allokutzneria multivorans TaxID=1142134 RepID=A0ABP7RFI7_9PSEU
MVLPGSASAAPAWVGSWTTAMMTSTTTDITVPSYTVRSAAHISVGGSQVRLRLSNRYGEKAAAIGHVTASLGGGPATNQAPKSLSFGGKRAVSIPAGGEVLSDPLAMAVSPGADVLVSIHVTASPKQVTYHRMAKQDSFIATDAADHAADTSGAAFTKKTGSWYFMTALDVQSPTANRSVATLGDSITDGAGSTYGNHRYPDVLARRLLSLPANDQRGVLNAGIGGNMVLRDGANGQAAITRVRWDVLQRTNVRTVILLEGINDIRRAGTPPTAAELTAGYRKIIDAARAKGVRVLGGTLLPFKGSNKWSEALEKTRTDVNTWVRTSGAFDAVVDFDAVMRDPGDPQKMRATHSTTDWLHPNNTGYEAMGKAVDLAKL